MSVRSKSSSHASSKVKSSHGNRTKQQLTFFTPVRPQSAKNKDLRSSSKNTLDLSARMHAEQCLCKQCICGRHMCKIAGDGPRLSMRTTYIIDYPPKGPFRHFRSNSSKPLQGMTINSPLLTLNSTYRQNYNELTIDDLSRPKPSNLLKCSGGPSLELTSYSAEYPGHKGKNQYVPVNPQLFRGGLPFNANTSYSKEYSKLNGKSSEKAKPPNQFSMTGSWLGNSSYSHEFQNPKNHVSPSKNDTKDLSKSFVSYKSQTIRSQKNPSSHFKTTYKNDYIKSDLPICPAASIINTNKLSKSTFKDNSNFKGMDSKYVSLAKFGSYAQ